MTHAEQNDARSFASQDEFGMTTPNFLKNSTSFLTTKEGMTFRLILYLFSDCKIVNDFRRIRHRYFLLACLFSLQRKRWHFVASGTFFLLACLFWLQRRGCHFVVSATVFLLTCLFWLLAFCCIRHHSLLIVCLSDYKRVDDILLHQPTSCCLCEKMGRVGCYAPHDVLSTM